MTALVLVALTAMGQQADPDSQKPTGLLIKLEVDYFQHQMYDPLFARVTIENQTGETVQAPRRLCHRAGYTIVAEPFRYRFDSEYADGSTAPPLPMAQGDQRIVDYEILQMPPIKFHQHDFWKDVSGGNVSVRTEVSSGIENIDKLLSNHFATFEVRFTRRPEEEAEFIRGLYAKLVKRDRENVTIRDVDANVDIDRPAPHHFGLSRFWPYSDLVQELLDHEEDLSPGSLRNIVHLTRMMRTIYDKTDQTERLEAVDEAVGWLDSLPEIQRECLLKRVLSWTSHNASRCPEENAVYFSLAAAVIKRMPKKVFYYDDYRAYMYRQFAANHAGFAEHVREETENRE